MLRALLFPLLAALFLPLVLGTSTTTSTSIHVPIDLR